MKIYELIDSLKSAQEQCQTQIQSAKTELEAANNTLLEAALKKAQNTLTSEVSKAQESLKNTLDTQLAVSKQELENSITQKSQEAASMLHTQISSELEKIAELGNDDIKRLLFEYVDTESIAQSIASEFLQHRGEELESVLTSLTNTALQGYMQSGKIAELAPFKAGVKEAVGENLEPIIRACYGEFAPYLANNSEFRAHLAELLHAQIQASAQELIEQAAKEQLQAYAKSIFDGVYSYKSAQESLFLNALTMQNLNLQGILGCIDSSLYTITQLELKLKRYEELSKIPTLEPKTKTLMRV